MSANYNVTSSVMDNYINLEGKIDVLKSNSKLLKLSIKLVGNTLYEKEKFEILNKTLVFEKTTPKKMKKMK